MQSPDLLYPELFVAVQSSQLFEDSKTFVDLEPQASPDRINSDYAQNGENPGFDLQTFLELYFKAEIVPSVLGESGSTTAQHITQLWPALTRQPESLGEYSSRINLPHPYVVPGGRFNEIYYWDSYFTQLGLIADGQQALVDSMVANFAALIDQVGFIPNGNRSYFTTRSQPPFFALMLDLIDKQSARRYLPQLKAEYAFWMDGSSQLEGSLQQKDSKPHRRVVSTPEGLLNRYWDDTDTPRPESYREDVELAEASGRDAAELYRDLRAGAESGWDFSSRWFAAEGLGSIQTTQILPVDLNVLLYLLEAKLAELESDSTEKSYYKAAATARAELIRAQFYSDTLGYFTDLNLADLSNRESLSMATLFPLFAGIATPEQAQSVAKTVEARLLRSGGWVTTECNSGQQWDAPNGWAPLQWIAFVGLKNYGFDELAEDAAKAWIDVNDRIFDTYGKMIEKYDVETLGQLAGGGEYAVQDGFGWSNGVYQGLRQALDKPSE